MRASPEYKGYKLLGGFDAGGPNWGFNGFPRWRSPLCQCFELNVETQRRKGAEKYIFGSAPLRLCIKSFYGLGIDAQMIPHRSFAPGYAMIDR